MRISVSVDIGIGHDVRTMSAYRILAKSSSNIPRYHKYHDTGATTRYTTIYCEFFTRWGRGLYRCESRIQQVKWIQMLLEETVRPWQKSLEQYWTRETTATINKLIDFSVFVFFFFLSLIIILKLLSDISSLCLCSALQGGPAHLCSFSPLFHWADIITEWVCSKHPLLNL